MHQISRRKFVALTAAGVATVPLPMWGRAAAAPVTAQEIVDRIKKSVGGEWKPDTVDTFKAGDPSANVTGIVTTSLATLEVLSQAVKAGANMVITSEPTFFSKADTPTPTVRRGFGGAGRRPGAAPGAAASAPSPLPLPPAAPDPVFTGKNDFIRKNNLIVWRFSDHWGQRTPNPFAQGIVDTMGWSKFASGDVSRVTIPETSLNALAMRAKTALKSRGGMRIVGDPKLAIRKVALLPGSTPIQASVAVLQDVDAILAGEVREWESVEYVRDTIDMGGKKALILVGRVVSEDPGMQVCAQWLKTVVPEVKATWIPTIDPYWRPTL